MISRRLIVVIVAFVSLAALFSITLPALASTTPPPGSADNAALDNTSLQNPAMAAAMARDLNLTPAQTQARLAMENWARRTESTLSHTLGATFGGAWITADAANLMVAVTDSAAAAAVRETGAQPRLVTRSASQLSTLKRALDTASAPAAGSVRGWYVDVPDNTVVVLAKPTAISQAQAFVAASGVDPAAVRVLAAPVAFQPLFDVNGGDAYFIDNVARCSVGFSVTGGFVTAGHCGQAGSTTKGFNQVAQGTFKGSTFPGNGDFALVQVNQQWTPQPQVTAAKGTVSVAGSNEAAVGASVCRSGSTTGWHCGVIQAKNATVTYPEGTVTGLTQTNVCAEAGDSGGSFISGNEAQGVTSGGSGNCTVGGTTFFQPVNEILAAFKATLVTSKAGGGGASASATASAPGRGRGGGSAKPPATGSQQPPAGATLSCNTSEAIFRGALAGSGAKQIQPSGAFYQTTKADSQLACLQAPADAEFNLVLQRWDGRRFQTVASAPAGTGNKTLAVKAPAGAYRWQVSSVQGAGTYTLGLTAT